MTVNPILFWLTAKFIFREPTPEGSISQTAYNDKEVYQFLSFGRDS